MILILRVGIDHKVYCLFTIYLLLLLLVEYAKEES